MVAREYGKLRHGVIYYCGMRLLKLTISYIIKGYDMIIISKGFWYTLDFTSIAGIFISSPPEMTTVFGS